MIQYSSHVMFVHRVDEDHLIILLMGAQVADEAYLHVESSSTFGSGDGGRGSVPVCVCFPLLPFFLRCHGSFSFMIFALLCRATRQLFVPFAAPSQVSGFTLKDLSASFHVSLQRFLCPLGKRLPDRSPPNMFFLGRRSSGIRATCPAQRS